MNEQPGQKARIPNPALEKWGVLVGVWETSGTHPYVPNKMLTGRSSFQWIEGGAFLIWRSEMQDEHFPAGVAIFGSDDVAGEWYMLYFDQRKVSRKYNVSFEGNVLKWWRNTGEFSQRYTWTISDHGEEIFGKGELSKDGKTWEKDLEQTFRRIPHKY